MTEKTANSLLSKLEGETFYINGRREIVEHTHVNSSNDTVTIRTDCATRKCDLKELSEHLKIYSKEATTPAVASPGIALLESLPQNANLSYIEESLIEALKKLRSGDKDYIPVAESINRVSTTVLNIQKSKIEMGKLIVEAHKTKMQQ